MVYGHWSRFEDVETIASREDRRTSLFCQNAAVRAA